MLLFLVSPRALAQIGSAEAQVNLHLQQVLSVQVSQASVSIPMNTPVHYLQGNSTPQLTNHLQVSATASYVLRVRTENDYFNLNSGISTLPVNTVQLKLTENGATGVNVLTPKSLSSTDTDIVTSNANEVVQNFNATYEIPQSETENYLNREEGSYSTTVIYTIVPQ